MKLVLFSGNHSRHLFVNQDLLPLFDDVLIFVMQREDIIPKPSETLSLSDKLLFEQHFENRHNIEKKYYKSLVPLEIFPKENTFYIDPDQLNTEFVKNKILQFEPDFSFIFGCDIIKDPVINVLPKNKINLHLGLSPWYKGAATLFWPFYFLQPQFCGITFHQISDQADAGAIIHQNTPELFLGQTIHEVGAECVVKARSDIKKLIIQWRERGNFNEKLQITSGRNWRSQDFHASHLRVIYQLFDDNIVDQYLQGKLSPAKPKIHNGLN